MLVCEELKSKMCHDADAKYTCINSDITTESV